MTPAFIRKEGQVSGAPCADVRQLEVKEELDVGARASFDRDQLIEVMSSSDSTTSTSNDEDQASQVELEGEVDDDVRDMGGDLLVDGRADDAFVKNDRTSVIHSLPNVKAELDAAAGLSVQVL